MHRPGSCAGHRQRSRTETQTDRKPESFFTLLCIAIYSFRSAMSGCDTFCGARLVLFLQRRPDIVAMETSVAMNRPGYRAHRVAKPLRYPDFLPDARIERRENRASFVLVLSGQIQI